VEVLSISDIDKAAELDGEKPGDGFQIFQRVILLWRAQSILLYIFLYICFVLLFLLWDLSNRLLQVFGYHMCYYVTSRIYCAKIATLNKK